MAYSTINKHTDYFNTKLYSGDSAPSGSGTQSVTGVGFQPDWIWLKCRSAGFHHRLFDAVKGAGKNLKSNNTDAEQTIDEGVTAFNSDGFSVKQGGSLEYNNNNHTYVSWNWKANGAGSSNSDGSVSSTLSVNSTAGFSIFKWTGSGSGEVSIGHGLGTKPKMWFVKSLSTGNWFVYTTIIDGSLDYLHLHNTDAKSDSSATAPTNQVIYGVSNTNQSEDYICYAFKEVKGYSKFSTYCGNGSNNGTFIHTGFAPSFVMVKRYNGASDWLICDNKRPGYNVINDKLFPNQGQAEDPYDAFDFLSNGFKIRSSGSGHNLNQGQFLYMAFGQPIVGSNDEITKAR